MRFLWYHDNIKMDRNVLNSNSALTSTDKEATLHGFPIETTIPGKPKTACPRINFYL